MDHSNLSRSASLHYLANMNKSLKFMLIDKKGLNLCHGRIIMMAQPMLMIIIVIAHISLLRDFVL